MRGGVLRWLRAAPAGRHWRQQLRDQSGNQVRSHPHPHRQLPRSARGARGGADGLLLEKMLEALSFDVANLEKLNSLVLQW